MGKQGSGAGSGFETYVDALVEVIGHADRAEPLHDYCRGLMLPVERKSVEPLAAVTAPARVSAQHQSLLHFVGQAPWSDQALTGKVRELVLPRMVERGGPITAWIVDDTSFPKKGKHSVGVARQYCGQLGKKENCQVAVSLSIANTAAGLPIAWRLYLPQAWVDDGERRRKAQIPDAVGFQTKPQIALDEIREAVAAGVPTGVILADAGYGVDSTLRAGLTDLGLAYVVGVTSTINVWRPGEGPLPPDCYGGRGRPPSRLRRDSDHQPLSVKALAEELPAQACQKVTWRAGTNGDLTSHFAAVRVRCAGGDFRLTQPCAEEWLMIEWPEGEDEPTKYWLSTLPADTALADLVAAAKLRWRIERDYLDLKQELGLGHYEGRGWRGFHHHASLCIAAYGFLILEQETIPPSGAAFAKERPEPPVPRGSRSHSAAAPAGTARANLDRHDPTSPCRRPGSAHHAMSMLRPSQLNASSKFMTQ
ncbi:IS701 family transposase [Consotaella aegiceratis]|uniref:IS701 family transposase n=1 Tax=Consotaella aegiceratis TaxID=3097961 RepID=UPI002F40CF83